MTFDPDVQTFGREAISPIMLVLPTTSDITFGVGGTYENWPRLVVPLSDGNLIFQLKKNTSDQTLPVVTNQEVRGVFKSISSSTTVTSIAVYW